MSNISDDPHDRLWQEYEAVFRDFDDLMLARWMAQTLGQLEGRAWRLSHPLVGTYRLAANHAHNRQIWHKRLATPPGAYREAPCCRAPLLPLFTREVHESGLVCQHCGESCVPFEEIPDELQDEFRKWAEHYEASHSVAHWDENQRKDCVDFDVELEKAATAAERLLRQAGRQLAPKLLEVYPAVIWEDQDECLEVRPEDIRL